MHNGGYLRDDDATAGMITMDDVLDAQYEQMINQHN
jgi:hypothetical protein